MCGIYIENSILKNCLSLTYGMYRERWNYLTSPYRAIGGLVE
jgi:hypothetical protein